MEKEPLVSIVTPFYNTAEYLAECIESVLAQTYQNWEYLLVNNCSTDGSWEIAQSYAARDPRIRLISNTTFLNQVQNYNQALRQIAPESLYCKVVQADDWIFPECVSHLAALAEANPRVGIVSSYSLSGIRVINKGLPYTIQTLSGKELCRRHFLAPMFVFGSPSSVLFRSEIVRQRDPFYRDGSTNEDTEACYEILQDWDFGFVHQILSYLRMDNLSISAVVREHGGTTLEHHIMLKRYGPLFLNREELARCLNQARDIHYRYLALTLFRRQHKAIWEYHQKGLRSIGIDLKIKDILFPYLLQVLLDILLNPKNAVERFLASRKRQV
ncbi:MAG: glycosyltransferase family 2 protein [Deltaproteobacteria bacterium]|nr:glycosyltransferase family 2 protein [Deltaproteobacteria bacterium]